MGIVVQKFGGSSVADKERLQKVANKILSEVENNNKVVVVVSAQGKTTDRLILEEKEITNNPNPREHDVLVSVGEQITISKLAMLLQDMGHKAISLTGWQIPIITTNVNGNAKIKFINSNTINDLLDLGNIVIVAGFQGVDENGNITTLGRGGSDTTAVALAAALKADKCDIYTDVDGVFSTDPRIVEDAIKINNICYEEMLELASMGAKVLHNRCVEIGQKYNVPIFVKSTFEEKSNGTLVSEKSNLEDLLISGITKDDYISRITLVGVENKIGKTYKLFKILSDNKINVDIIMQSLGEHAFKDISFTVKMSDLDKTLLTLEKYKEELNCSQIIHKENLSKVSIVGVGIANKPGVAADMFEALYENDININMISTSEIKISVLIDSNKTDLAIKAIHNKFFK